MFLHDNLRDKTELDEIRVIKASPYLHSLSHDSRNFFGQFFPCDEMYTVPATTTRGSSGSGDGDGISAVQMTDDERDHS